MVVIKMMMEVVMILMLMIIDDDGKDYYNNDISGMRVYKIHGHRIGFYSRTWTED